MALECIKKILSVDPHNAAVLKLEQELNVGSKLKAVSAIDFAKKKGGKDGEAKKPTIHPEVEKEEAKQPIITEEEEEEEETGKLILPEEKEVSPACRHKSIKGNEPWWTCCRRRKK